MTGFSPPLPRSYTVESLERLLFHLFEELGITLVALDEAV